MVERLCAAQYRHRQQKHQSKLDEEKYDFIAFFSLALSLPYSKSIKMKALEMRRPKTILMCTTNCFYLLRNSVSVYFPLTRVTLLLYSIVFL